MSRERSPAASPAPPAPDPTPAPAATDPRPDTAPTAPVSPAPLSPAPLSPAPPVPSVPHLSEPVFVCANCHFAITGPATFYVGVAFCCAGCVAGGPCTCSYDPEPAASDLGHP